MKRKGYIYEKIYNYVIYPDYVKLRKTIKKNMTLKMKKINKKDVIDGSDACTLGSYNGWIKHCNGVNLSKKYMYKFKKGSEPC